MSVTNRHLKQFLTLKQIMQFDTFANAEYLMTGNNMAVGLNMPVALKSIGRGADEQAHGLPPHAPRRAFLVDEYPACPPDWLRSSGRIKSYFVPIKVGHGLWLDFNMSLQKVAQDVAIVISAQGVNAITGMPCKDAQLEQYLDKCPKHKEDFGPDRLCKSCGHKWPKQNYLCSSGQPGGQLWLDGFRAEDGVIRQYVFTEDQARSVAKAIIGGDRVFALGISYFVSKTARPEPVMSRKLSFGGISEQIYTSQCCAGDGLSTCADTASYEKSITSSSSNVKWSSGPQASSGDFNKSAGSVPMGSKVSARLADAAKGSLLSRIRDHSSTAQYTGSVVNQVSVKKVEIAAGAKVNQRIYDDPNSLEYWQTEPTALIVINYCTEEDAERIIAAGKIDLSGHPEGFLQQVPSVGSHHHA